MLDDPLPKNIIMIAFIAIALLLPSGLTKVKSDSKLLTKVNDSEIIANAPHFYNHYGVLATVNRIMFCESTDRPHVKNPDSSAYGFCQFLDQTWDYVQDKWKMELDRESPADQFYACKRLYEEEGESHWLESIACWGK